MENRGQVEKTSNLVVTGAGCSALLGYKIRPTTSSTNPRTARTTGVTTAPHPDRLSGTEADGWLSRCGGDGLSGPLRRAAGTSDIGPSLPLGRRLKSSAVPPPGGNPRPIVSQPGRAGHTGNSSYHGSSCTFTRG